MKSLSTSENSVVHCDWNRRWEVRGVLCSTFAAKKQNTRPFEVPSSCGVSGTQLSCPSLHVEVVQTAGLEGKPTPPLSWRCSRLKGASWGKFLGEPTWFLGQETSGRSQEGEGWTAKLVGLVHRPLPGFVRHWHSAQSWPNLCSCEDSVQGCHPMSPLWDLDRPFFLAQAHPTLSVHRDESSACSLPHST